MFVSQSFISVLVQKHYVQKLPNSEKTEQIYLSLKKEPLCYYNSKQ